MERLLFLCGQHPNNQTAGEIQTAAAGAGAIDYLCARIQELSSPPRPAGGGGAEQLLAVQLLGRLCFKHQPNALRFMQTAAAVEAVCANVLRTLQVDAPS